MTRSRTMLLLVAAVVAACAKDPVALAEQPDSLNVAAAAPAEAAHDSHAAPADTTTKDGLTDELRADLAKMEKASGPQAEAMLPGHRQLVANMIATFNAEMRSMNMPMDAAWTAMVDSLRRDLVSLAGQDASSLPNAMPPHVSRVRRLGNMHATMLATMKH